MSGETYSIYVKVDSTQALTAAKNLEEMGEASVTAEVSLKNLGKSSSDASNKIADATKAVKQLGNEYRNTAGIIDSSGLGAKLGMGGKQVVSPDIAKELNRIANQASITDTAMTKLGDAAKYVRSTFVLFVGIEIARFLRDTASATTEAADAYTDMKSKLDIATYSQKELNKAFEDSFNIANKYYTSVTDVASAYAKFNPIVASLGRNTADTAKIVSSLSASLLISGNNTVDAAETFRQFAQAISGPKVQMEEMNTIIDSNQALWRGLQREFPDIIAKYGSLKEAISKQAISNEMLINATIKLGDEFEALAARKVPTIANSMAVLSNSFLQYVGEADDASGASSAFANIILDLAESLRSVEGKGQSLATVINTIAQAMAGTKGAVAEYIDMINSLSNAYLAFTGRQAEAAGTDPELARLMQLGRGNVPIADLAAKPNVKPTTQPQLTPKGTGGGDAKQAAKDAKDALAAFKALIDAQVSAAENSEKIFAANANNSKKRFDLEADQIKGIAELKIRATKSESVRLAISEEAQTKIIESINQETNLRQAGLDKEIETVNAKLAGVQQEIDAADAHKLKQAERLELTTKQAELETELTVKRAERTQIELDAIGQIQSAEQSLAEARQQANETLVKEEALRQLEIMSSNLEYAKEMATGLAEAFGEVGAAIGGMSVAMAEYDKQATTIEIARKEAVDKAEGDQKRITEINDDAARKQAKAQIKSYGDMTQAAQGFFKKGTKGYEAMGAAVKVFRVFEMAQSAMSMVKQIGDMGSILGQFLGMEQAKTAEKIASNSVQQASDQAGAVTSATKAVADAGQGDPYTGIIRAAAMLAFMAAIGIAVGGGGGGSASVAPPPPETGTGTVFGDPTAVSESIGKSIAILEENSSNDLNYSADMLDALYQIRDALGGLENLVASDLTPAITNLMTQYGDGLKQAGFIFRDQQLSKVMASGKYEGYIGARVETESSQMMITVKKGQTMVAEYGDKFAKEFFKVIETMRTGIDEVGKVIGVSESQIVDRLKGFKIKGQQVDIAGLSAEEAAKKLEAAFSAMSDTMAMKALPEFKDFKQSGEGYFETIVRVSEGISRAKGSLELLGMEAIKYTDIIDKNKDVAAEITRQTIMAQGDLSEGTREYVRQLQGSAADIIDSYKQILNITNLMRGAGFGTEDIDRTMINAAGGLSAFEEALQSFRENFMTDEQRLKADTEELTKAFAELSREMPKSKDEFYAIAMGMDRSTEEGKKLFAQFIKLNPAFAEVTDAAKELADAQAEAAQASLEAARKAREEAEAAAKKIAQAYEDAFFTPEEKTAKQLADLKKQFDALGVSMPDTKEGLRKFLDGLNLLVPAQEAIYNQIVLLAPAFANAADAAASYALKQEEAARKAREAEYEASKKQHDELMKALEATASDALAGLKDAYQNLQKTQERFIQTSKTLRTYLLELTNLQASPERRYESAMLEFRRVASLASQGNEGAIEQLDAVGKEFLDASREYNASSLQFQKDRDDVIKAVTDAISYTEQQVDTATKQLQAIEQSHGVLLGISTGIGNVTSGVLSVAQGINNLITATNNYQAAVNALAAGKGAAPVAPTTPTVPAPTVQPIPMPKPVPVTPVSSVPQVPGGRMGYNPFHDEIPQVYNEDYSRRMIRFYYQQLLGREPEGESAYTGRLTLLMNELISADELAYQFRQSQEHKDLLARGFIPGFAKGGMMSAGLSLVGEYGPELVSSGGGYVSSAGATANFFKTIKDAVVITSAQQTELLKEQVAELQALVRLQSAASREMITQLSELRNETAEATRIAKVEASA
jgi:tape measure domain-containing protein